MSEIVQGNDLEELGRVIRDKREQLRLTQEELADRAKVSVDTIHRIELGKTSVRIDVFFLICDILEITPYDCAPPRYKNTNDKDDLHIQFSRLNAANQAFLKKQIGELIAHLLILQRSC